MARWRRCGKIADTTRTVVRAWLFPRRGAVGPTRYASTSLLGSDNNYISIAIIVLAFLVLV